MYNSYNPSSGYNPPGRFNQYNRPGTTGTTLRNWLDYNPDPLGNLRPTKTRKRYTQPYLDEWYGKPRSKWGTETYQQPVISSQEIIDTIREQINEAPVRMRRQGGQTMATRRFQMPERPSELSGYFGPLSGQFSKPGQKNYFTTSWRLPEEAYGGMKFNTFNPPATDAMRQMGYSMGVTGANRFQAQSRVNPQSYWPESSFDAPLNKYGSPMPGAVIDYTTGKYYAPGQNYRQNLFGGAYGRFGTSAKTPPNIRFPEYTRFRPPKKKPTAAATTTTQGKKKGRPWYITSKRPTFGF